MENETWEEIFEWEVEEDLDLANRLTTKSISINTDNNNNSDILNPDFSFSSSSSEESEDENYEFIETYKRPTFANILKGFPVMPNTKNLLPPQFTTSFPRKSLNNDTNNNQFTTTTARTANYPKTELSSSTESIYDNEKEKYRIQRRRREQKEITNMHDQRIYGQLLTAEEIEMALFLGEQEYANLEACRKAIKFKKKLKDK
ncbi:5863_t:CDS:1 [Ambispora gerdemannii]|uniref:5863_t:CDS:1 n=1 Tax=Ambispora gerdemannii TaxID=144530 RepID=A0A9N9DAM2_9GLOM|nr:5863_t:CDS:1 [Ambispora gerdemannii]